MTNVADFLAALTNGIAKPVGRGDYAFPKPEGGHYGFVQFIIFSDREVTIHRLWAARVGDGGGKKILQMLCHLADAHGVVLNLKPLPIGRKPYPLSRDQLAAWYRRHGFEGTKKKMSRKPQPVAPAGSSEVQAPADPGKVRGIARE